MRRQRCSAETDEPLDGPGRDAAGLAGLVAGFMEAAVAAAIVG